MNVITLLLSATSQGMLWSLLAIGVYMTFRILDIADLTAEGSFPLGGGIAAIGIVNGMHPAIATLLAFGGGMLAGLVTGILNTKFKIPALLAGIITMTGLYSVTSRVMGAPNIALLGESTVFTGAQNLGLSKNNAVILVGLLIVLLVILLLVLFFRTEIGLAVRATGDNPDMSEANGIKTENMKLLGYMISNGSIALSGALLAQNNGFADLNSGVVAGAIIYRFILALVFEMNVEPTDSKLASAIVLVICLSLPQIRSKFTLKSKKKGADNNATSIKN